MMIFSLCMAGLYIILSIVPFSILRYYPFLSKLRVRPSSFWVIYGSIVSLEIFWFIQILQHGHFLGIYNAELLRFIFYFIYLGFSCLIIREAASKHLFVWLVSMIFSSTVTAFAHFINSLFLSAIPYLVTNIALLFLLPCFMFLCFHFLQKFILPLIYETSAKACRLITSLLAVLFILTLSITPELPTQQTSPLGLLYIRLLASSGSIIACFIFKTILDEQQKVLALTSEKYRQESLLAVSKEQFVALSEKIEEAKRARHDLKHHFAAIQGYLTHTDYDGLLHYIVETQNILPPEAVLTFCDHPTLNMILSHYYTQATTYDIPITIRARTSSQLPLSDTELWVVLGNLLENAIDASRKMNVGERQIKVALQQTGTTLGIAIDNRCEPANLQPHQHTFLSTKGTPNSGNGLISVSLLAQNHHGMSTFEVVDGWFFASVHVSS